MIAIIIALINGTAALLIVAGLQIFFLIEEGPIASLEVVETSAEEAAATDEE